MNQTYPVHGIRRLGKIVYPHYVTTESSSEAGKEHCQKINVEVDEVVERYFARLDAAEADPSSSDL
jgi:hypothetical protein